MKKQLKEIIYVLIIIFTILITSASTLYLYNNKLIEKESKEESKLIDIVDIEESNKEQNDIVTNELPERVLKVRKLKQINEDIVGWLEIEGTSINYPVLQGTDDNYYMNHNYKKEKSKKGSIFLSKDYDWTIPSCNLLIYGHNLQNGTMFEELLKYENEDFYKKHPTIRFTTKNEDSTYEIISVFKSRVYYKSEENVFRYYFFTNAETEKEYNEFIENAKKASLYDIEASAEYKDELITLSTCSYHTEDGRFAIVGRKIK